MPAADKHQKTEKPTAKHRKESRQKGQIARSADLTGWGAVLLGSYLLPWYFGFSLSRVLGVTSQAIDIARAPSVPRALVALDAGLRALLLTALPLGGIFALLALVAGLAQTRGLFSLQLARPKFSRLSPRGGFSRLFSPQTLQQLAKQLLKLVALAGISYSLISKLTHEMVGTRPVSLLPVLAAEGSTVLTFVRIIAAVGFLVGVVDYMFQRRSVNKNMKMTKDQVKDESKSAEGDPHVKGMVRKRMYQISRSKMRAAVRQADVVVTNPTHYAVALQYNAARAAAPRVLAKGADLLAARIRSEALEHGVPLVEDPPLARYLYAICEVEQQIPAEIYLAVAKVLAFVYALPQAIRTVGVHHPGPSLVPSEPAAMGEMSETRRAHVVEVLTGAGVR